jgi:hypothetical protein
LGAQGTKLGREGFHLQGSQRHARRAYVGGAPAAVDDGASRGHASAGGTQYVHDFTGAASRGHHVFNYDGGLARGNRETAAQRHFVISASFRENATGAQMARYLMTDHHSAEGGGGDEIDLGFAECANGFGEPPAQVTGRVGMLQHQRALQVGTAMHPAGKAKVALKVRAFGTEEIENGFSLRLHKGLLYH